MFPLQICKVEGGFQDAGSSKNPELTLSKHSSTLGGKNTPLANDFFVQIHLVELNQVSQATKQCYDAMFGKCVWGDSEDANRGMITKVRKYVDSSSTK